MNRDPFWLTARYNSLCQKCKEPIAKGTRIYYYPIGKVALCEKCGEVAERDFKVMREYEDGRCTAW